jgi:hypothetical protein
MRGLSLLALAPALSFAALGAGSVLAALAGLRWGWGTAAAATALGVGVAWLVGRLAPIRAPRVLADWPRRVWFNVLGAVAVASSWIFGTTLAAMGGVGGIPQSWDLVYHGNLARFILETGDASPFHAGLLNSPGAAGGYYPSGLHALAALAPAGAQVWPALNAVALVAGSLVWVLGLVYLSRVLFAGRPGFAIAAAALAVLYQGQPTSMVGLMANSVGVALVPALLAWSVQLARVVTITTGGRVTRSLILLVAVVGSAFAHPAALFSYAAVASPIALYIVVTVARRAWRVGYRISTIVGLTVLALIVGGATAALYATPEVRAVVGFGGWTSSSNPLVAVVLALTDATTLFQLGPNLLVTAGLATGAAVALVRRRRRWLVLSFSVGLVLYVGAVAKINLLEPLTGLFYSDRTRLGPLLAVAGIPLILWGLDWVVGVWRGSALEAGAPTATAASRSASLSRRRRWIAILVAVGLVNAIALSAARPFRLHQAYFALDAASQGGDRRFFDADELAMINRLADKLEPDGVVLGDPANGSAFLYSVIGQPVVFPHITGRWDEPRRYLRDHFAELGSDPAVCAAIRELGVEYVYLDTRSYRGEDRFAQMTGGLAVEGNLELVDRGGSAAVYRITACG